MHQRSFRAQNNWDTAQQRGVIHKACVLHSTILPGTACQELGLGAPPGSYSRPGACMAHVLT